MIRLVEMDEGHIEAVHRLDVATNPSPWTRSLFVGELVLDPATRSWVVAVEGDRDGEDTVVGFAGVTIAGDDAHLMAIAVTETHRRRGLAKKMFDRLCKEAIGRGAINLTLEVRENNLGAVALYEELGMHSVGKRPRYYSDGTDAVIMWLYDLDRIGGLSESAAVVEEARRV